MLPTLTEDMADATMQIANREADQQALTFYGWFFRFEQAREELWREHGFAVERTFTRPARGAGTTVTYYFQTINGLPGAPGALVESTHQLSISNPLSSYMVVDNAFQSRLEHFKRAKLHSDAVDTIGALTPQQLDSLKKISATELKKIIDQAFYF